MLIDDRFTTSRMPPFKSAHRLRDAAEHGVCGGGLVRDTGRMPDHDSIRVTPRLHEKIHGLLETAWLASRSIAAGHVAASYSRGGGGVGGGGGGVNGNSIYMPTTRLATVADRKRPAR